MDIRRASEYLAGDSATVQGTETYGHKVPRLYDVAESSGSAYTFNVPDVHATCQVAHITWSRTIVVTVSL